MFREVIFNKWVIGGIVLVIVFVLTCQIWYHHEKARYRQQAAETAEYIRKLEASQKVNTDKEVTVQADDLRTVESITQATEKKMTEIDSTKTESSISDNPADAVKVSPYGFGPYPEVPDGFLEGFVPSWEWSEEKKLKFGPEHLRNQEAIARVLIKLWNQGDREFYGAVGDDKVVRPLYPDAVYIEWGDVELPDGTTLQEISGYCAPEGFPILTMKQRMKGKIPAGYRVLDMQGDAIYVSEFLNDSNNDSN